MNEELRQWFIHLSDMIGGELSDDSSFEDGLEWFGNLPEATLEALQNLGRDNPSIQEFWELGESLLKSIQQ